MNRVEAWCAGYEGWTLAENGKEVEKTFLHEDYPTPLTVGPDGSVSTEIEDDDGCPTIWVITAFDSPADAVRRVEAMFEGRPYKKVKA